MKKYNVDIVPVEERIIYGLWMDSSDNTVSKDIGTLCRKYREISSDTFPLFIFSRNYSTETKRFELFIGGTKELDGLSRLVIPKGDYAKITIRPKFKFMWGFEVGSAKIYFYRKWLPMSPYKGLNLEYEYHTEKTIGKNPELDILFGIEKY